MLLDYWAVLAIYAVGTSKADQRSTQLESKPLLEMPEQPHRRACHCHSAQHGRGFSVEPENVRKLSGRCGFQNQKLVLKGHSSCLRPPFVAYALQLEPSFRNEIYGLLRVCVLWPFVGHTLGALLAPVCHVSTTILWFCFSKCLVCRSWHHHAAVGSSPKGFF